MFAVIRRWRRRRMLATAAIPEPLWREALDALPFLAIYTDDELVRLRERVVVFLSEKSIVGAAGFVVTPPMRVVIAMQACAPALWLDADCYDGWETSLSIPTNSTTRANSRMMPGSCIVAASSSPASRCPADRSCCPGRTSRRTRTGAARG